MRKVRKVKKVKKVNKVQIVNLVLKSWNYSQDIVFFFDLAIQKKTCGQLRSVTVSYGQLRSVIWKSIYG